MSGLLTSKNIRFLAGKKSKGQKGHKKDQNEIQIINVK